MKEIYIPAELTVTVFDAEDVITTSPSRSKPIELPLIPIDGDEP